jgi:aminoglycoside phosphotransferase family enzyme/predicted kinase
MDSNGRATQTPLLASLLRPEAYPHPVESVRLIETHISWVFLTGERAYKVKKPVQFPFVDLRSSEQRAIFCREELRLNRRFAPDLYLAVCEITQDGAHVRIGGNGRVIDHAVCMLQFRTEEELDKLLASESVALNELDVLGRELAARYRQFPAAAVRQAWGRAEKVRDALWRNFDECAQAATTLDQQDAVRELRGAFESSLQAATRAMQSRRADGRVREVHGDLHARNVVRHAGRLAAFDCMEFEPAFRWIDVAADIAFLFMDIDARAHPRHAQAFRGGYLFEDGDYDACRVMRVYAAHAALVRAKVTALEATDAPRLSARERKLAEFQLYAECARRMLTPARPSLIITCGLSGSGKTWLAQQLAPSLGAVHVRSDVERKRIGGLKEQQQSNSALGQGLYSQATNAQVYQRLTTCAGAALEGGYTVIVDATFQRTAERAQIHAIAAARGVATYLVLCHAPTHILRERIATRAHEATDASEADAEVLERQIQRFETVSASEGLTLIDADTTQAGVVDLVLRGLVAGR